MGYSLEFVELTNSDKKHTFEIKDVSDKLGPNIDSISVKFDFDINCEGFGIVGYFKTEDGKLMCKMKDGSELNYMDVLIKFKPKEPWD
jgi:RNA recognition motif-containing protein